MNFTDIARLRLYNQHIIQADFTTARDVLSWMGAIQAQDYNGALWSIGLRSRKLTRQDIEQSISNREIVRTWPMRGTLHFLAAEDVRWMIKLLTPQIISGTAGRRRQLELDDTVLRKSRSLIENALSGGKCLTRDALCRLLDDNGVATTGQRGVHILLHLSEEGVLCFGPHEGKQPTFVLLEEWIPPMQEKGRDESLSLLAKRYFISHGPATLKDFAGWGKMTLKDSRLGIELARNTIRKTVIDDVEYWHANTTGKTTARVTSLLLPGFDEYMLGYKDRTPALEVQYSSKIVPGNNGMFLSTIVVDGQVVGTWKKTTRKSGIQIQLTPFVSLNGQEMSDITQAAKRYSQFMQAPVEILPIGS